MAGASKTRAPVATATKTRTGRPSLKQGDNCVRVRHKEFIRDCTSSQHFHVESDPINPGIGNLFPWLSSIAKNYEKYIFHGLKFYFNTLSPTSIPGSIMALLDYDASNGSENVPLTKAELLAGAGAVRAAPWQDVSLIGQSNRLREPRFVRANKAVGGDLKTYDAGRLVCATSGQSNDGHPITELWVEYDVELQIPTVLNNFYGGQFSTIFNETDNLPLGTSNSLHGEMYLDINHDNETATFTQAGEFVMFIRMTTTGASSPTWPSFTINEEAGGSALATLGAHYVGVGPPYEYFRQYALKVSPGDYFSWSTVAPATGLSGVGIAVVPCSYDAASFGWPVV